MPVGEDHSLMALALCLHQTTSEPDTCGYCGQHHKPNNCSYLPLMLDTNSSLLLAGASRSAQYVKSAIQGARSAPILESGTAVLIGVTPLPTCWVLGPLGTFAFRIIDVYQTCLSRSPETCGGVAGGGLTPTCWRS